MLVLAGACPMSGELQEHTILVKAFTYYTSVGPMSGAYWPNEW